MSSEKYSNDATTTLNGAINNSTTTVVVTSAAAFPATGQFRIAVTTSGVSEIMLVTSVSSNTFTVATRGTIDGSAAASHNDLDSVRQILTKGALDQIIADNIQTGAYASLPSAEKSGRLYLANDAPFLSRDNGSTWDTFYPAVPVYPPAPGLFTTFTGGSTITFGSVIPYTITATGTSLGGHAVIAIPTPTYTISVCLEGWCPGYADEFNYGLGFFNNGSTKIQNIGASISGGIKIRILNWINYTGPNALVSSYIPGEFRKWFRVSDDGTNLSYYSSLNGLDWILHSTLTRASFLGTPSHVGVTCQINTGSNSPAVVKLISWKQT